MDRSRPTESQRNLRDKMLPYVTKDAVIYHPVLLVGSLAVGKTWLARRLVGCLNGSYFNIATDCFAELLKYTSLPNVPPEDVAALVQSYARQQPSGPVFVDGLDAVLTAIAVGQRPGILANFFTAMRRTRDLPHPTVLIVQLNTHVAEGILRQSDWWNRDDCYVLNLTARDRRIIAENRQVMPAVADQAKTALEIVFPR